MIWRLRFALQEIFSLYAKNCALNSIVNSVILIYGSLGKACFKKNTKHVLWWLASKTKSIKNEFHSLLWSCEKCINTLPRVSIGICHIRCMKRSILWSIRDAYKPLVTPWKNLKYTNNSLRISKFITSKICYSKNATITFFVIYISDSTVRIYCILYLTIRIFYIPKRELSGIHILESTYQSPNCIFHILHFVFHIQNSVLHISDFRLHSPYSTFCILTPYSVFVFHIPYYIFPISRYKFIIKPELKICNPENEICNSECAKWNVEFGMRNTESGKWNLECTRYIDHNDALNTIKTVY